MGRRGRVALLASASLLTGFAALAEDAAQPLEGSLYPASAVDNSPLARALGPARYILDDIGQSEEFREQIRRAVGIHPVLHREISRRDEVRGHLRAERAALYPRLSANLTGDYVISREFGANTDNVVESLQPDRRLNAGLSVTQLVFDGGAAFQRIKGAKAHQREQEQTISARINQLSLEALSAYHDLATHQAVLKLGEDFIRRHQDLLADVEERERLGAGTMADVMQARARLAATRARVAQIKESTRLAEVRYEEFFRAEPGVLARPSFDAIAVGTREEAAALAVERNPEIGAAIARFDRAQADYKAARAGRFPEVHASVNGVKYDFIDNNDDYDVRAGLHMEYDIFAGGARGAAIAQAGELARQERFEEDRVRLEIERDAAIAFEQRAASVERLDALADSVVANYEARALIAERFRVARGELIDLLQAENDYFEAAVAYLAGVADRDMATYGLMEHTGDLLRFFSPQPEYAESEILRD